MKKAEIRTPFLDMVEDVLEPLGFEKQKTNEGHEYIRKTDIGFACVTPFINQYDTLFFISLAFQLRIDDLSEILVIINDIGKEYEDAYPTLSFGISSFIESDNNRIKVETPEELVEAIRILRSVLANEAVELFNNINSVADMDLEMNRENRPKDLYTTNREMVGLISAVLNNNPKSEHWENYYRDNLKNANEYSKNQYENLVIYLRDNQ